MPGVTSGKRPNFLLIITDQQRADYLGCTGHPLLRTPHIDGIAARGVTFDRCYVASPVCMPNRATLMTGRMPSAHGVRSNGIPLSVQSHTCVDVLRAGGYRTALIGKSHLQNFTGLPPIRQDTGTPGTTSDTALIAEAKRVDAPASAYANEDPRTWQNEEFDVATPFYGFDHVELCTLHGDMAGAAYKRWLRRHGAEPTALVGRRNQLAHDYVCPQAWRTAVPEALYPTRFIGQRCIEYLATHAARRDDAPFFLTLSFPDPHHPFTPPGRYWDMYDPADMVVPQSFFDIGADPPPPLRWAHAERVAGKIDRERGQFLFVVDEREAREAIALTCGMISCIDDEIGRVLAQLQALGLDDDTVVVYTSDHGDFLGDHGLLLKGPIHYQSLIRVPLLWRDPAAEPAAGSTRALCGTIDLAPTMLDRAGLRPYNGMQGRSLLREAATLADHGPGCVLIEEDQQREVFGLKGPPRVCSLVTGEWRMSLYDGTDWGELYHLSDDPLENRNLWFEPTASDAKARLLETFVRRQIALIDRSPAPSARA
jgi:arylsulfatase A-like enzyme